MQKRITINEITLRDGLQNIKRFIPTEEKLKLLEKLVDGGAKNIECTAFVSPRWVPQMSDAKDIVKGANRYNQIRKFVLVPNIKGYELAISHGIKEVVTFLSASEIHNQDNVNRTIDESLIELQAMGVKAKQDGILIRANLATAFGYRKNNEISTEKILSIINTLEEAGYQGVTLCDTIGIASPDQVYTLSKHLIDRFSSEFIAIHLHQCDGIEYANAYAAFSAGIHIFDSAAGGLGGCPFAPDSNGNIATELLVRMFNSMGVECGINMEKMKTAALYAKSIQHTYS